MVKASDSPWVTYVPALFDQSVSFTAMPLGGGVDTLATGGIEDDDDRDQVETPVFDKHDRLLHGEVRR